MSASPTPPTHPASAPAPIPAPVPAPAAALASPGGELAALGLGGGGALDGGRPGSMPSARTPALTPVPAHLTPHHQAASLTASLHEEVAGLDGLARVMGREGGDVTHGIYKAALRQQMDALGSGRTPPMDPVSLASGRWSSSRSLGGAGGDAPTLPPATDSSIQQHNGGPQPPTLPPAREAIDCLDGFSPPGAGPGGHRTIGCAAEVLRSDEFGTEALRIVARDPGGMRRLHYLSRPGARAADLPPARPLAAFLLPLLQLGGQDLSREFSDDGGEAGGLLAPEDAAAARGSRGGPSDSPIKGQSPRSMRMRRNSCASAGSIVPEARNPTRLTSDALTFATLVKANFGPAHLYLAKGFSNGGVWFSLVCLFGSCLLNCHCIKLLIEVRDHVGYGSFPDLGKAAYGERMYNAVQATLVLSQYGLVATYFIFIAESMRDAISSFAGCSDWAVNMKLSYLILLQLVIQVPLALLRYMKQVALANIIATVVTAFALVWIIVVNSVRIARGHRHTPSSFEPSTFAMFVGTSIFTFEGIGIMLPIHAAMRNKEKFVPMVYKAFFLCCVFFSAVGFTGYVSRGGPDVNTNILLSLEQSDPLTHVAEIIYSLDVLLSFPLQAFPAYRIVEIILQMPPGKGNALAKWRKNALRCVTVAALAVIAWAGSSNLDNFVSILGGVAMCPLAFVYPALFHHRLVARTPAQRGADAVIATLGVTVIFFTTGIAVWQWVTSSPVTRPACVAT